MKKTQTTTPKFVDEAEEADWWASPEGRTFVKRKSVETQKGEIRPTGSNLVRRLKKVPSIQIALRLPEPDVAQARKIATRKGIGYQTLLKMLVHEGLRRESRRT